MDVGSYLGFGLALYFGITQRVNQDTVTLGLKKIVKLLLLDSYHVLLNNQHAHCLLLVELVKHHRYIDQNHAVHPEKNFALSVEIRIGFFLNCNLLNHGKVRANKEHRTVEKSEPFNIVEKHAVHIDKSYKILATEELEIGNIDGDPWRHDVSHCQVDINA